MTYIKKMKIQGFKSFAKTIDLPFSKDFSAIIGPNGSGKSIYYDTLITLSDGKEAKIGDLIEEQLKNNPNKTLKDGIYCESHKTLEIVSINPLSMKQEMKKVSKFIRREGEELYHIRTSLGKEVKATGCHPIMVFREGVLKSTLIRDLNENDLIATPRHLSLKKFKQEQLTKSFNLKIKQKYITEEFARFLGYMVGDGHLHTGGPRFTNKDLILVKDFQYCTKEIFPLTPKQYKYGYKNSYETVIHSRRLSRDLQKILSGIKANEKQIPNMILSSNNNIVSNFLGALYDTDGCVRKDIGVIEYCSKNKILTQQIQRLLLRFGIISKVKRRISQAHNTKSKIQRPYWYLYIYGQENLKKFCINIPLKSLHKKQTLEKWASLNKIPNPNNDLLPKETNLHVKKLIQLLGIKIKNERKQYPKLAAYYENICHPTRPGIKEALIFFNQKLITLTRTFSNLKAEKSSLVHALSIINIPRTQASAQTGLEKNWISNSLVFNDWKGKLENLQNLQSFIQTTITDRLSEIKQIFTILQNLANSDIYWDRITSIEKIEKVPYVYDLTIPDNHNFVGNGIFVHNSNVVDSLCFVLGRLSSKSMRANNSAKLIYNGGKKGKAAKEAYVSIVFDNSTKVFPAKAKEIEVKRVVRHTGQSKYYINGELRTRQQIMDLLGAVKINPDGHNIILQGDITHAAEMPSEERRHIIEDIAGISVFEDKKIKANKELEKVEGQLSEVGIVLSERGTYLKELKKDYDQASRYKDLEKNVGRNKATYLNIQIKSKEERLNKVLTSTKKNQDQINLIGKNVEGLTEEKGKKENELEEINNTIERSGETSQQALHKEVEGLKDALNEDKTRLSTLQNEIKSLNERKSQLKSSMQDSDKRVVSFQKKKGDIQKQIEQLGKEEGKKQAELGKLKQKYNMDDLESELGGIDSQIDGIKAQNLEERRLELLREKDRTELRLNTINKIANKKELSRLSNLKNKFKQATENLNVFNEEDTTILNQLSSARIKMQQIREEHVRLKTQQSLAKESSYSSAVNRIKASGIQGVYGSVAELANVPSEYSMAIEVAAGARLNSIIVKDDKIASRCIEYLRSKKLGTAIFLPLNKLKAYPVKKVNVGHGLAIDLVKFESKFKAAFSYVFGSTVVVDNINEARGIGIGKHRMVTLEGDLVEASGAMIGGFRRKKASLFLAPDIDKNINNLTSEVTRLKNLIQTLEKNLNVNEDKINAAREEKSTFEGEILKIQAAVGDIDSIEEERDGLADSLKQQLNQLKEISSNIENNAKSLQELNKKRGLLREKIGRKRNPKVIADIEVLENNMQKITEKKILLSSEINNLASQIDELILPEKESMSRIVRQNTDQLEQFSQEINQLNAMILDKTRVIREKEKEESKLYSNFKGLLSKREKLNETIQKHELKINNEQNKTQLYEERINTLSLDKAKVNSELQGLKEQMQEFQNVSLRKGLTESQLRDEISKFESLMRNLGNVNLRALEIYEQVQKEYGSLEQKSDKLKSEKEDVLGMIEEVESKKTGVFMKTFNEINKNFENIFSQLTVKGTTAQLVLENPEKPLEAGIQIMVKIAHNKFLDIKSLSGGEKTMTALAFIFSIQEHDPAPFYLLDEVDAALDKKNSEKLSELVKKYSEKAQYIMITHNDSVISGADKLYGVSMHKDGMSHVVSLKI